MKSQYFDNFSTRADIKDVPSYFTSLYNDFATKYDADVLVLTGNILKRRLLINTSAQGKHDISTGGSGSVIYYSSTTDIMATYFYKMKIDSYSIDGFRLSYKFKTKQKPITVTRNTTYNDMFDLSRMIDAGDGNYIAPASHGTTWFGEHNEVIWTNNRIGTVTGGALYNYFDRYWYMTSARGNPFRGKPNNPQVMHKIPETENEFLIINNAHTDKKNMSGIYSAYKTNTSLIASRPTNTFYNSCSHIWEVGDSIYTVGDYMMNKVSVHETHLTGFGIKDAYGITNFKGTYYIGAKQGLVLSNDLSSFNYKGYTGTFIASTHDKVATEDVYLDKSKAYQASLLKFRKGSYVVGYQGGSVVYSFDTIDISKNISEHPRKSLFSLVGEVLTGIDCNDSYAIFATTTSSTDKRMGGVYIADPVTNSYRLNLTEGIYRKATGVSIDNNEKFTAIYVGGHLIYGSLSEPATNYTQGRISTNDDSRYSMTADENYNNIFIGTVSDTSTDILLQTVKREKPNNGNVLLRKTNQFNATTIEWMEAKDNRLLLGTDTGILYSENAGLTFTKIRGRIQGHGGTLGDDYIALVIDSFTIEIIKEGSTTLLNKSHSIDSKLSAYGNFVMYSSINSDYIQIADTTDTERSLFDSRVSSLGSDATHMVIGGSNGEIYITTDGVEFEKKSFGHTNQQVFVKKYKERWYFVVPKESVIYVTHSFDHYEKIDKTMDYTINHNNKRIPHYQRVLYTIKDSLYLMVNDNGLTYKTDDNNRVFTPVKIRSNTDGNTNFVLGLYTPNASGGTAGRPITGIHATSVKDISPKGLSKSEVTTSHSSPYNHWNQETANISNKRVIDEAQWNTVDIFVEHLESSNGRSYYIRSSFNGEDDMPPRLLDTSNSTLSPRIFANVARQYLGDDVVVLSSGKQAIVTFDRGKTFQVREYTNMPYSPTEIFISKDDRSVIANYSSILMRSVDYGNTFNIISMPSNSMRYMQFNQDGKIGVAAGMYSNIRNNCLLFSQDGGNSWTNIANGTVNHIKTNEDMSILVVSISVNSNVSNVFKIMYSLDKGHTWIPTNFNNMTVSQQKGSVIVITKTREFYVVSSTEITKLNVDTGQYTQYNLPFGSTAGSAYSTDGVNWICEMDSNARNLSYSNNGGVDWITNADIGYEHSLSNYITYNEERKEFLFANRQRYLNNNNSFRYNYYSVVIGRGGFPYHGVKPAFTPLSFLHFYIMGGDAVDAVKDIMVVPIDKDNPHGELSIMNANVISNATKPKWTKVGFGENYQLATKTPMSYSTNEGIESNKSGDVDRYNIRFDGLVDKQRIVGIGVNSASIKFLPNMPSFDISVVSNNIDAFELRNTINLPINKTMRSFTYNNTDKNVLRQGNNTLELIIRKID